MYRPTLLLLLLVACTGNEPGDPAVKDPGGDKPGTSAVPVCALPAGTAELKAGDANHDGQVDVSDGVWTLRHLLNGGSAPACVDAQDVLSDEILDIGDALAIFYLYTGQVEMPRSGRLDCDEPAEIPEAACGVLDLAFATPAAGQVGVMLTAPELAVQAWSFGVKADGCTITGATESGSVIADKRLDGEGHRDVGFTRADAVDGGLTHVGVLSWKTDVALPASATARRLLNLEIEPPATGCTPCSLSFTDALEGAGPVVPLVVTSGGRSYVPTTTAVTVDICAP